MPFVPISYLFAVKSNKSHYWTLACQVTLTICEKILANHTSKKAAFLQRTVLLSMCSSTNRKSVMWII